MEASLVIQKIEQRKEELLSFLKPFFAREEARLTALKYTCGLMSRVERKNSWQLAEEAGLKTPYCFQHLLGRAVWDADLLRDNLQRQIADKNREGILAIDETGFLKKGKQSAGVKRQYSGTAGRIENCQIGVFLSYATKEGQVLIDRELYISADWIEDKKRCQLAGIPSDISFKTKPQIAQMMLQRAFKNGICPSWIVGDEVYGVHHLRSYLEQRKCSYVLAVKSNQYVCLDLSQYMVSDLVFKVEPESWRCLSAGRGTKGNRDYDWHRIKINSDSPVGWSRWLLFRRNLKNPQELAYYIVFCPDETTLQEIVKVAGSRWTIEECFGVSKGEVGLDHYEVRSYVGWYRHMTLCLLAMAFLNDLREDFNEVEKKKKVPKVNMKLFLKQRKLV
jgi:SRSO17 transposase